MKSDPAKMAAVSKRPKPKERHLPLGARPARALGQCVKQVRESKSLSQRALAEKIGTHFSQVSLIENGANVEVQWYERAALALGFKNAYELVASGGDELTRKMLRLWKRLQDDGARKDALKIIQAQIVAELERDAT